jgi:MYND finger
MEPPNPCFEVCACCNKGSEDTVKALGLSRKRFGMSTTLLRCSGCRSAYFCSKVCQKAVWKTHKVSCLKWSKESLVSCVVISDFPNGRSPNLAQVYHPLAYLQQIKSFPSPVMSLIGIPLNLSPLEKGTDNQWCTYMMIDPASGFAPYQFQDLGKCLLWRPDLMPITADHVSALGDFFCSLLDRYGDGLEPGEVAASYATKQHFAYFVLDQLGSSTREDNDELCNDSRGTAW